MSRIKVFCCFSISLGVIGSWEFQVVGEGGGELGGLRRGEGRSGGEGRGVDSLVYSCQTYEPNLFHP